MGKHESIKDEGAPTPAPSGDGAQAADTPMMALASIELPKVDVAKIDLPTVETPKIESPSIALTGIEAPNLEPPNFEPPKCDTPQIDQITGAAADFAPASDAVADAAAAAHGSYDNAAARSNRFPLLAASLAAAAAIGAMVGGLIATSLVRSAPAPVLVTAKTGIEEVQALKEQVVQARVDLRPLLMAETYALRSSACPGQNPLPLLSTMSS